MSRKPVVPIHYIEEDIRILSYACSDIIEWYKENRRDFPWRNDPTPYRVWISEVMLQQTRIETVLPYYRRFMAELPNPTALAEVSDERLLKLWEGLGYYTRAKNLKRTARILVRNYDGFLPHSAKELKKLPGIGDYTAGAISSIAFHMPEPAVDGNVLRVVSRLIASYEDVSLPSVKARITELLRDVYPNGEDSAFLTEGLMELGETICTPGEKPNCRICPVREECVAHEKRIQKRLPVRKNALPRRAEEKTVLLLHYETRYALNRRGKGLLADMWEIPTLDGKLTDEQAIKALSEYGIGTREITPICNAKHAFSHVEWYMTGYRVECANRSERLIWETPENIRTLYAIPSAYRKYLKFLEKEEKSDESLS